MSYPGKDYRTLMGVESVCCHCWRGWIAVPIGEIMGWPAAHKWASQNAADLAAHQCEGKQAERAAKETEETLWRQEHAKRIRRRV